MQRPISWAIALVGILSLAACGSRVSAQDQTSGTQDTLKPLAPTGEPASSFPAPSRGIADIVAPRWTAEEARDDAGEFARVAKLAGVKVGMHVADIGAGDGYYVARLSPLVGGVGRVYGEDIIPSYLTLLQRRVLTFELPNALVVRGEPHDPRLPPGELDLAFMIHMYHEIEQPFGVLWNLATAMKRGGRLVILDLERPTFSHGTPISLLRCELRAIGYAERSYTRTGAEEYVAIFDAPSIIARPTPAAISARLANAPCRVAR